jgi:hypothetical protein
MKFKYYSGLYKVEYRVHKDQEIELQRGEVYLSRSQAKAIFELIGDGKQNHVLNITSIERKND